MTESPATERHRDDFQRGHWEAVATTWGARNPEALWRLHSDAVNAALVARWLPEGSRGTLFKTDLFDEAVSPGLLDCLAARAERVLGADLSRTAARMAVRRAPGLQAFCADVRALPLADASLDTILSNSTLDHFRRREDLVQGLRELHRTLRPDGQLLLTLDNRANPVVALRNALPFGVLNRLGLLPYYVGWTCGPGELSRLLGDSGFEVREMTAILHCPRLMSIKIAALLDRRADASTRRRYLDFLFKFERLARWPTRYLTGYYLAVRATRTQSPPPGKGS